MELYSIQSHEIRFDEAGPNIEVWTRGSDSPECVATFYIGPDESELVIKVSGDNYAFKVVEPNSEGDGFDIREFNLKINEGGGFLTIDIRDSIRMNELGSSIHVASFALSAERPDEELRLRMLSEHILMILKSNS